MKKSIDLSNKDTYENTCIAEEYSLLGQLKKPEQTILNNIRDKLGHMKMLDVGVGGGRTTVHFAKYTKEYIGIDYSENMINVCRKRFSEYISKSISFKVCDARNMEIFENSYFDFILFSWNGIDYMHSEDRVRTLEEIARIGKKGGLFCFSTHNLQHVDELFALRLSKNPIRMLRNIVKYVLIRVLNKDFKNLNDKKNAFICDGAQMFRLVHHYINPREQIKQLKELGFKNIKIYSHNGHEIEDFSKLDTLTDLYLYYLCNV